jgi:hypothetical protein
LRSRAHAARVAGVDARTTTATTATTAGEDSTMSRHQQWIAAGVCVLGAGTIGLIALTVVDDALSALHATRALLDTFSSGWSL